MTTLAPAPAQPSGPPSWAASWMPASLPPGRGAVRVLLDPDDSAVCVAELCARHDLVVGVAVCHPTAPHPSDPGGPQRPGLARDVLVALGKRPDALTVEHLASQSWDLARCWMGAEAVRELVVLRAHLLPAPAWRDLAALTRDVGARLWLVCHQARLDTAHRDVLAELASTTAPAAVVDRPEPWRSALEHLPAPAAPAPGFPPVPDADFPVFRATARQVLDPIDFARVDAVYTATFPAARAAARRWRTERRRGREPHPSQDRELAAAALQRLTIDADTATEVQTRVRATQAGFFYEGIFLGLAVGPNMTSTVNTTAPRLDGHTAARLRGLADPAAAALLALARVTGHPAELHHLTLADIAPAHDALYDLDHGGRVGGALQVTLRGARYRVPATAAAAVRAYLVRRRAHQPADPAAAVFTRADGAPIAPLQLRRLLGRAAAYAGVALPPPSFRSLQVAELTTTAVWR